MPTWSFMENQWGENWYEDSYYMPESLILRHAEDRSRNILRLTCLGLLASHWREVSFGIPKSLGSPRLFRHSKVADTTMQGLRI